MSPSDLPPPAYLMQLVNGKIVSRAVSVAADLGIADHLKDGERDVEELAALTGCNGDALYRLLRTLSAVGVFAELPGRSFQNNPVSEALRTDSPASVRDAVRWGGTQLHWQVWTAFDHSVRTGKSSFDRISPGKGAFEVLKEHPEAQGIFNAAMTSFSHIEAHAIVETYDFEGIRSLVDVAGGHGGLAMAIKKAFPATKVTVLDLPHVIEGTREAITASGLDLETVPGDMFESVPPADAYIMKHIIHDWDDDDCIEILGHCRDTLTSPEGRILVCEWLVTDGPDGVATKIFDLEMLAGPGGRERTEAEFASLFERCGLKLSRVVRTGSPIVVLEATRA